MLGHHLDGDECSLPRRLRRCSVAGGVADFETTLAYDDSDSDTEGEEEGGRPLSCSEGESGTDGEGEGEAYVPSRGPGLAGPAGNLSRPLDIPRAVPVAALAARRKSIASVKQASLHAHHAYMQQTAAGGTAHGHRNSLTASHALSPSVAHTYGANSFVSAGSASADSSSTAWAASPAADNFDASAVAAPAGEEFYKGFIVAPSSLPLQGLTMLPAVPLPLPSSSVSRRSISPFTGAEPPTGRCNTDPAAVPAAFPSHYAHQYNQQHRLSVTAAMPSGSPLSSSSSYGLPYGLGGLQSRAASCGSTSGGSSNASPQGAVPAPSSGSSAASSSGSFTFSAAARFLPPSGAASSSYSSASYGAGGYGIGGGLPMQCGGGSSAQAQGSTFASPSSVSSTSSFSLSTAVSPLPPRAPLPPRFSSPPTGVPSPSPAYPAAAVGGGGAQLEEITSYEEIAHCPPHIQAGQSRRTSVAASTAALDLPPSMQAHHASHAHARPLALRCAGRAERDALQFEEEYDDGLQDMDSFLGSSANIMPASGSPQSGGFELEFEM